MARQYNIRWSDKDEREIQRVVKNFNAKVKRVNISEPFLRNERPETIRYKDIRNMVQTRQDLNRSLNKLKRFSRRNSEDIRETQGGVITTQWQFKEAVIMQRVITTKRRKKREGIDSYQQLETESLFDKPKVGDIKERGFKQFVSSLEKEIMSRFDDEKKILYLKNYIKAIGDELGIYGNDIISYVKSIPLDTFIIQSLGNPFLRIEFIYTEEEKREIAQAILEEWQRVT